MAEGPGEWAVLADGFQLAEAPRWDGEGVWFTDVLGGGVFRWTEAGVDTIVPKRRGVGGLALHESGGVVASGRDVIHVAPDGTNRQLFSPPDGVTGFNDLAATPEGGVVVGGLRFAPFAGEDPVPGSFWRVTSPGVADEVVSGIEWPNGVGYSPDGRTLYVCDYSRGQVVATADGAPPFVFAETPNGEADGLAVDAEGGVWVALGGRRGRGGLARFLPNGALDVQLPVPAGFVTSLTFGGRDGRDLFVTTAASGDEPGALLRSRSPVAGATLPHVRI